MSSRSQEGSEIRLGEVVEASTTQIVAQCYELYTSPPLGSLVRCGTSDTTGEDGDAVYGIVYEVSTHSIDPGRRPIARGRDEDDEDAVYEANPQLSRLLSTEFRNRWWSDTGETEKRCTGGWRRCRRAYTHSFTPARMTI